MYKFAVFGNPVQHSLSPTIHNLFARQCDLSVQYDAIECTLSAFAITVRDFFLCGGHGANVTLPFKEHAFALANTVSSAARLAGAANTLCRSDDRTLFAENTDGLGLIRDLTTTQGLNLTHCRILLLGAGGAARGVLGPLMQATTHPVTLVNRTLAKAKDVAAHFSRVGKVITRSYAELADDHYDVIINATSASLSSTLPALPDTLSCRNALVYDMMYSKKPTIFMQWAKNQGASVVCDGLGMLLEQAAESFYLWTQHRPEVLAVRRQLLHSSRPL